MTPTGYDLEPHLFWLFLESIAHNHPSAVRAIRTIKREISYLDLELMDAVEELVACTRQFEMPMSLASVRLRCSYALNNRSAAIRNKLIPTLSLLSIPEAATIASGLTKGLSDVYAFHAEHVRLWRPTSIRRDWYGYRIGVCKKVVAIAQHLRGSGSSTSRWDVIFEMSGLSIGDVLPAFQSGPHFNRARLEGSPVYHPG